MMFPPANQNIMTGPQLNPWLNRTASSGIPTASTSVNTIRGPEPYSVGVPPRGMPSAAIPTMLSRPPLQSMTPPVGALWSPGVVNRMKPDEPKPMQASALDLLGQEALNAHKETQSKVKAEQSKPVERKDATLLDLNDSTATPLPTPPIIAPPPVKPTSQPTTSLDQLSVPMDKIQPG